MQSELLVLRKRFQDIPKKISIVLMSYEKIDEEIVTVSEDSVNFYGILNLSVNQF